jgi:hypothetical protein
MKKAFAVARDIKFTVLNSGAFDGPKDPKQEVITNDKQLLNFFDGERPHSFPKIKIEGIYCGISLGLRTTGGYSVEVKSVSQHTIGIMAGFVEVRYKEYKPDKKGMVIQVLTYPYTIIHLSEIVEINKIVFVKLDDPIEIIKAEARVDTMPIQPTAGGTLKVEIEFNGNGRIASLVKRKPQGINAKILLLEISYGMTEQYVANPQTVSYQEGLKTSKQYNTVEIYFEGMKVGVIMRIPIYR